MTTPAVTSKLPLLRIDGLRTWFRIRKGPQAGTVLKAVDGVTLDIRQGEILGLVGESGCGKSTLGKSLMGIEAVSGGSIDFDGTDIVQLGRRDLRRIRNRLQYVYQDPGSSLDPRWIIGRSLDEPLVIHTKLSRAERRARVRETIRAVGLLEEHLDRYPHELSGGQQRRVGLARILTLHPKIVILDEPTSGLDVSVQATILKLLLSLRIAYDLTYLFISHDLGVVRAVCDRVAVMYLGRIVEVSDAEELFSRPRHPYTRSLLAAIPQIGERKLIDQPLLEGDPPDPSNLPSGCRFRNRCRHVSEICAREEPELIDRGEGRYVACHFPVDADGDRPGHRLASSMGS